jgi:hypothetical protein
MKKAVPMDGTFHGREKHLLLELLYCITENIDELKSLRDGDKLFKNGSTSPIKGLIF